MRRWLWGAALALWSVEAAAAQKLVAVLPLNVTEASIKKADVVTLEESIRTIAGDEMEPSGFTVLAGETMLRILEDNGLKADKACDASCALESARELSAEIFISGIVTTSEGQHNAFVRLFESRTGRQLASVHLEGTTARALREQFKAQAGKFFAKALSATAPAGDAAAGRAAAPDARGSSAEARQIVAVFPFDAGSADREEVEALTESLRNFAGTYLSRKGHVLLTSETMLQYLEDNGVDPMKAAEAGSALDMARTMRVRYFFAGKVMRSKSGLMASIRLLDANSGRQLAALELRGANAAALQADFDGKVGSFMNSSGL